MGKCTKCGTNFISTPEQPCPDVICVRCELDILRAETKMLYQKLRGLNKSGLIVWSKPATAKKWPEGIVVIIRRPDRPKDYNGAYELRQYFRPDWVDSEFVRKRPGGGKEPTEFARLT